MNKRYVFYYWYSERSSLKMQLCYISRWFYNFFKNTSGGSYKCAAKFDLEFILIYKWCILILIYLSGHFEEAAILKLKGESIANICSRTTIMTNLVLYIQVGITVPNLGSSRGSFRSFHFFYILFCISFFWNFTSYVLYCKLKGCVCHYAYYMYTVLSTIKNVCCWLLC